MKTLLTLTIMACALDMSAQAPVKDTTSLMYNSKQTIHKKVNRKKDTMYLIKDSTAAHQNKILKR